MLRSLSRWLSKLFQGTPINKQGQGDAPASHPLTKDVPTKPPTTAKGTESGLNDTPPPSYEAVCPGPVEAGTGAGTGVRLSTALQTALQTAIEPAIEPTIRAVENAQPIPQDSTSLKPIDGVQHRVHNALRRLGIPDADHVLSGILQLCCFTAYRVSENHRGNSSLRADERRQPNHRQIDRLLSLAMKPVTPECLERVINMTVDVFEEVVLEVMAERNVSKNLQVRREFYFMKSSIYRVAVRLCTQLAEDNLKTFPTSTLAGLVSAAECFNSVADSYNGAAKACIR
ncbi:hypothetical protein PG996_012954 [Apiospora saccharicola]|uniref:Uncharacterized protein n=1 Tax=Apiospora saccharicola TaxID=335842 RepID=A0ABR1U426_9PEZI